MGPRDELLQGTTRRHFLREMPAGLGALALASLLKGESRGADRATLAGPLAPKAPPKPARAKNVIYLHMSGAPPHLDLFDYKPELVPLQRRRVPLGVPRREAVRLHDRDAEAPGDPEDLPALRRVRHLDVRRPAEPPRRGRRALRGQIAAHRSVQPRPGRAAPLHRLPAPGAPLARVLGDLRARDRESRPPGLRRPDLQRRPAERRPGRLGQRLPAIGLPGGPVPVPG